MTEVLKPTAVVGALLQAIAAAIHRNWEFGCRQITIAQLLSVSLHSARVAQLRSLGSLVGLSQYKGPQHWISRAAKKIWLAAG